MRGIIKQQCSYCWLDRICNKYEVSVALRRFLLVVILPCNAPIQLN